jgi:beta-lactamase class A
MSAFRFPSLALTITLSVMRRAWTYTAVFALGLLTMFAVQVGRSHFAPCKDTYDLLNPIRRCGNAMPQGEWNYEPLREELTNQKAALKASGEVTHLSVYFQDLDHGPRFGVGEYENFQAASLLKVPLLIYFLHAADIDPAILEKTASFSGKLNIDDNVEDPAHTIQPGTPYTIRELLQKMIVHSDNRSYALLLREMNALSQAMAYYTFRDLDVLRMMEESDVTYVPVPSFARLFAILYNTGYLSKDRSQYALELLSQTTFPGGIAKGVPEGQKVAHKFGYAFLSEEHHLHDCGIVYHPKMAYVLCVMTTSNNPKQADAVITQISKTVYEAVSDLDISKDADTEY